MRITIIYDNSAISDHLIADWGFSCLVETERKKILFDTGGNGRILLDNMHVLGIDPLAISDIVISHPDFDHIGGLSHFLNANEKAIVHNPVSFRGVRYKNEVRYYSEPTEIYPGIYLTGELAKREQSLAVRTEKGLVLIIGCGHPGLEAIIEATSDFGNIDAIIGGLHDFQEFDILTKVRKICPTHCTKYTSVIKENYPDKYIPGGAGRVIEL